MQSPIVMVSGDKRESLDLCTLLERHGYKVIRLPAPATLDTQVRESNCRVLLLDLDHIKVDNRFLREFSKRHLGLSIIALSSRTFHPELEEALSSHISACLLKPVDMDELLFWLRSLGERKLG